MCVLFWCRLDLSDWKWKISDCLCVFPDWCCDHFPIILSLSLIPMALISKPTASFSLPSFCHIVAIQVSLLHALVLDLHLILS